MKLQRYAGRDSYKIFDLRIQISSLIAISGHCLGHSEQGYHSEYFNSTEFICLAKNIIVLQTNLTHSTMVGW